jgi:hypothetical protein
MKRSARRNRGGRGNGGAGRDVLDAVFVLPESEVEARVSCPCCWLSLAVNLNWGVDGLDKVIAAAGAARKELAGQEGPM